MTAMDAPGGVTGLASRQAGPGGRVRWRALARVAWRQQRAALLPAVAALGAAALVLAVTGIPLHEVAGRLGPDWWENRQDAGDWPYQWLYGVPPVLQVLLALIAAFTGAPVVAREAEAGTIRFAWSQGAGRIRPLAARFGLTAAILAAAAAGLGLLYSWWLGPLASSGMTRDNPESAGLLAPSLAAWVTCGVAAGFLAGALLRRTVPAIALTLASYGALSYLTATRLRPSYLPPLSGPASRVGRASDIIREFTVFPAGQHHPVQWAVFQPASRFWTFQWIESGWLLVLSAALIAAAFAVIRRWSA
jgi:hypothetical protein